MRFLPVVLALLALSFVPAMAQTSPSPTPALTVTTRAGDINTPHEVDIDGVAAGTPQTVVVFDPAGQETVLNAQANAAGHASWLLSPPQGGWNVGLYRVAYGLQGGKATSVTFVAGDGKPHVFVQPYLPSPTSALNIVGFGLEPDTDFSLSLWLTGGAGQHDLHVRSDAAGTFSLFVWPEQFALPFFAAGDYRLDVPVLNASVQFVVREHPASSTLNVAGPIIRGGGVPVSLSYYQSNRSIWGLYADGEGKVVGEFLAGPTNAEGSLVQRLWLALPSAGQYLLATPYDWGETSFQAIDPPATPSPTPTDTVTPTAMPTSTPTLTPPPTATPTKTPKPVAHATKKKKWHWKCVMKGKKGHKKRVCTWTK